MKRTRRDTVRKLYREAIRQAFGSGDSDLDKSLLSALKKDIHIAGQAPGEWVGQWGVLEIYCESGIPNASDVHSFPPMPEFGYKGGTVYNSETWCKIDKWVNLGLQALGKSDRVHHEPWNGAVIGVFWS